MGVSIRKMRKGDIEQVQDVAKRTWNATYDGLIPMTIQEKFLSSAYSDESMQRRMERSLVLVAELDGSVAGFANFSGVNDAGIVGLGAIYIYPEQQGKGIGSALLGHAIKELDGVKEIYVDVERDNLTGRNFYEAKNFKVVREFDDDFDGHTLKTVEMMLRVYE